MVIADEGGTVLKAIDETGTRFSFTVSRTAESTFSAGAECGSALGWRATGH